MSNFLNAYSIQNWLESCPQGYLAETDYGHAAGMKEPEFLFEDPQLREDAIRGTVQLVAGERCALAASAGLVYCAPDHESKRFLATQTRDEARHVEIFMQRLYDLGVKKDEIEDVIANSRTQSREVRRGAARESRQARFYRGRGGPEYHSRRHGVYGFRDDVYGKRIPEPEIRTDSFGHYRGRTASCRIRRK